MGRGPEFGRRIAKALLISTAVAGVADLGVAVGNSSINTSTMYRAVDESVTPSEGENPYDKAYWEKIFAKLDATGVTEQSHRDATVAYASMLVSAIATLALIPFMGSKNRLQPKRSR